MSERHDPHGTGVAAADGDGHAADADRDRVAAEGAQMQGLDGNTLVKAEMPEAICFVGIKQLPVDREDARLGPELEPVERDCESFGRDRRRHLRLIINNGGGLPEGL
jgi:hypothetical protein